MFHVIFKSSGLLSSSYLFEVVIFHIVRVSKKVSFPGSSVGKPAFFDIYLWFVHLVVAANLCVGEVISGWIMEHFWFVSPICHVLSKLFCFSLLYIKIE